MSWCIFILCTSTCLIMITFLRVYVLDCTPSRPSLSEFTVQYSCFMFILKFEWNIAEYITGKCETSLLTRQSTWCQKWNLKNCKLPSAPFNKWKIFCGYTKYFRVSQSFIFQSRDCSTFYACSGVKYLAVRVKCDLIINAVKLNLAAFCIFLISYFT